MNFTSILETVENETALDDTYPGIVIQVNATKNHMVFEDPTVPGNHPYLRWGMKFLVLVLVVIIIGAAMLVSCIMLLNKRIERRKREAMKQTENSKGQKLASALTSYKWHADDPKDLSDTSSSSSISQDSAFDESLHMGEIGESIKSKTSTQCAICAIDFEDNVEVYESNNPNCRHIYHKNCMDKWLNYQYACPICNEIFVLQTC